MRPFTARVVGWAWLLSLFIATSANAVATFDESPTLQPYAQQVSTTQLGNTLQLLVDILSQHNRQHSSPALQLFVEQLQAILQPDCCDYFTALPTVKGLTATLSDVVSLQLPATIRPVVRRGYVAAIWVLQRSRFFTWDSSALHKSMMSGLSKLYQQHVDNATGRCIRFHHISKSGGTTLCSLAWDNGCRGPGMSKKHNCLLDLASDRPVWVLRHNATDVNHLSSVPVLEAPPAPPVMADPQAEAERLKLVELLKQRAAKDAYDWFMYDCPAHMLYGKVGRPCSELQQGVQLKSATFFAGENTLPLEQNKPQVCEAFTNVVMLRDAMSEVVSLMTEVGTVYTRMVKQSRVLGWVPPQHDLAWWQQWAPAVISSYATRTLLGPEAFCPRASQPVSASGRDAAIGAVGDSTSAGGDRELLSSTDSGTGAWVLGAVDQQAAARALASFDLVLDLARPSFIDVSTSKLLGWSTKTFTAGRLQRTTHENKTPAWADLELMARQLPPPLNSSLLSNSRNSSSSSSSAGVQQDAPGGIAQGPSGAAANQQAMPTSGSVAAVGQLYVLSSSQDDKLRRMIGAARVRQVYSRYGMSNVLLPMDVLVPLLDPPAVVVDEAMAALQAIKDASLVAYKVTEDSGSNSTIHLLVEFTLQHSASSAAAAATQQDVQAASTQGVATGGSDAVLVYHVWPKHGITLTVTDFELLQQTTAADAALYQHGQVMQAVDAAWASSWTPERSSRKMRLPVQDGVKGACGFAGVNVSSVLIS